MRFIRTNVGLIIAMLLVSAIPSAAQKRTQTNRKKDPVTQEFGDLFAKQARRERAEKARARNKVVATPSKALGGSPPNRSAGIPVLAAESKVAPRPAAAGNSFARSFNQKVAPKGTKGARGNRAVNPQTGTLLFPIKPKTRLLDSNGRKSGVVAATEVKINYGATRVLKGKDGKRRTYHQAWSTPTKNGELASGWVPRASLTVKPMMPKITAKRPPSGPQTSYTIRRGNPLSEKFGRTNANGDYVPFKVTPRYADGGRNASDYLLRPNGIVNQSVNLPGKGGVSHDSYRPGTIFTRADSIRSVRTRLYNPGGTKPVGHLTFVYGTVRTPSGPRHGWMPLQTLRRR